MTKLCTSLFSVLLLSAPVLAYSAPPMMESNSLHKATLEITADNYNPQTEVIKTASAPYTHETERNNSLFRGALAKQGVAVNLRIDASSEVSYSRYSTASEQNNSLFRGALAK